MVRSIYNDIKSEYEKKQKAAHDSLVSRKAEIYKVIPRIQEIDNLIQLTGIRYNKMILSGKTDSDEAVRLLLDEISSFRNEKTALLEKKGYPANYLEVMFQCPHCNDTGYVYNGSQSDKCVCYKQNLIDKLYRQSNLKLISTENFDFFDESYYPDKVDEAKYGISISPRENIMNIKNRCLRFVENFESSDEKNLFFSGRTGVGKTFMANCIAMEIIKKGYTVLYQTSSVLFNTINEYRLNSFKDADLEDMSYDSIFNVDLLIIDDLGTEPQSAARYAELLNILNTRHSINLSRPCKIIISSNLGAKNIYEYYTERVASRISGNFDSYMFTGEDIRTLKKLIAR